MLSLRGHGIRKLGLALLGIGMIGLLILTVRAAFLPSPSAPIIVPDRPEPTPTALPPARAEPADAAGADRGDLALDEAPGGAGPDLAADIGTAENPNGGAGDRNADDGLPAQPPRNDLDDLDDDGAATPSSALPSPSRERSVEDDVVSTSDDDTDDG